MGSRVRNDDRGNDLTPFRVFRANHRARAPVHAVDISTPSTATLGHRRRGDHGRELELGRARLMYAGGLPSSHTRLVADAQNRARGRGEQLAQPVRRQARVVE
jgi:hypothetical protein